MALLTSSIHDKGMGLSGHVCADLLEKRMSASEDSSAIKLLGKEQGRPCREERAPCQYSQCPPPLPPAALPGPAAQRPTRASILSRLAGEHTHRSLGMLAGLKENAAVY